MSTEAFDLKKTIRFLPHILLVGLGIGTANYTMYGDLNWLQWTLLALTTSFIIGYTLVTIGLNNSWFKHRFKPKWQLYLVISLLFILVAVLATEIEHIIRSLVFRQQPFKPGSAGKMYLFNGIISLVLGYSFFHYNFSPTRKPGSSEIQEGSPAGEAISPESILNIPVKTGETISFIPIEDVVYFEAFDNYSFVFTPTGEKKLCDYSLLFLEQRLGKNFSRVHRKYIVNERHIKKIKPHLNGRYLIEFDNGMSPITSSKGHSTVIRKLIKIQ